MSDPSINQPRETGQYSFRSFSAPDLADFAGDNRPAVNYDEVIDLDQTTVFMRNHEFHRTDGFAIDSGDGSGLYFVDGVQLTAPGDVNDFHLDGVSVDGVQSWRSGTGNREVRVHPDGSQVFTRDGDTHRSGGPAVIAADGSEKWFNGGTELPNPWPAAPTASFDPRINATVMAGSQYSADRTVAEIGAAVREDITLAIRTGILTDLGLGYNVRGANGQRDSEPTVHIDVLSAPQHRRVPAEDAADIHQTLTRLVTAYRRSQVTESTGALAHSFDFDISFNQNTN
jgi:hypothetical protein